VAICFYSDNSIYFFKDDVGRKSFGFTITNMFYAGSIGFETEVDPNFLYQYRIRDHKLLCVPKDKSITCQIGVEYHQDRISHNIILLKQEEIHVKWRKSEDLKSQAHILENLLIQSCKRRTHRFDNVLFFGGGIDSLIIAITLNKVVEKNRPIYLVNTSFDGEMSWDRFYGLKNYHALCNILKERKYVFVRNDISLEEVKRALPIVKKLIYPKISIMDLNIGLCHYFSAKKAQNYTKVVYTGMGADELFGGYSKYSKKTTSARCAIDRDVAAIYKDNIGRDDRVVADNAVEMRSPFLDKDVIKFALSLDVKYLVNTGDKGCSKAILRELLTLQGFKTESKINKKAVQFGSGLKKMEKEYK
ncbi:Asparagine synthase, partial [Trachipleistophora hominis]